MNFSMDFSISGKESHWDSETAIGLLNSLLKETFARQIRGAGGILDKRKSMIKCMKR